MRQPIKNNNVNMLAADPELAVQQLIKLTRGLISSAENETAALVRGDIIRLTAVQDEKEKLAHKYAKASEEFRRRIGEFRQIDKSLLAELEKHQGELCRKTDENNVLIARTRMRSSNGTPVTLVTAQELGQVGQAVSR